MSFDKVAALKRSATQTKEEMVEVMCEMAKCTADAELKVEELQRQIALVKTDTVEEEPTQKIREQYTDTMSDEVQELTKQLEKGQR